MSTSRRYRSVSPDLPGLSRASTPDSSSPSTPRLPSSFPRMSHTKPSVGFPSSPVSSSYRAAEYDELSVMREFAIHAIGCESCGDPGRTYRRGQNLCQTGTGLAKDIGKYFYCYDGKPHSVINKRQGREKVQVEVPAELSVVKNLFEALQQGLRFSQPRIERRATVHQPERRPSPARVPTREDYYDTVTPARTSSRRQKDTVYGSLSGEHKDRKYETRSPDDERYRDTTVTTVAESEQRPRNHRRGSLYVPTDRKEKRRSTTYVLPFTGLFG